MRGIHSVVDELRRSVFEEVARMAYEDDVGRINKLPYKIIPGEVAHYRDSVFRERAIVTERLRLACGLPLRSAAEYGLPGEGIEEANIPEKYYEPPLINIIPFACNACPEKEMRVSSNCQGCLSHPCQAVCPKNAISTDAYGHSVIDNDKCIKCGRCVDQCPYDAISKIERPCAKACGMDAIHSDEMGRAKIDYDKCVSCGMCLVNWAYARGYIKTVRPFGKRSLSERRGIHPKDARPSAGRQTVLPDSVDSLAWHIAIVGIAVLVGFGILQGCKAAEIALFPEAKTRLFLGFPMFPLCMLGGAMLQIVARLAKVDLLVDRDQMTRISGAALDYLALSAVTTIQLSVVVANWMPLTIMVVAGIAWTVFAVMFFSPRLFREAWFERGIAEFGQATGVTATGLLLLRTVDPDSKTIAAASFAGKQLLHEPAMNLWVALAFALVLTIGWLPVFLISFVMLTIWIGLSVFLMRHKA